jgi:hypothetical protein
MYTDADEKAAWKHINASVKGLSSDPAWLIAVQRGGLCWRHASCTVVCSLSFHTELVRSIFHGLRTLSSITDLKLYQHQRGGTPQSVCALLEKWSLSTVIKIKSTSTRNLIRPELSWISCFFLAASLREYVAQLESTKVATRFDMQVKGEQMATILKSSGWMREQDTITVISA